VIPGCYLQIETNMSKSEVCDFKP